jgi:dUTP pyrophosphatase
MNGTTTLSSAFLTSNSTINNLSFIVDCQLKPGAKLPQRAHHSDAGADLFSYEYLEIYPNEQKLVDTGIAVKIPQGYAGFVYNRSSQGKKGITIPHSVGVIDSGYRDTIKVLLKNIGDDPYKIIAGDRIAQLVIQKVELVGFKDIWNDSTRGTGGFGSTGT